MCCKSDELQEMIDNRHDKNTDDVLSHIDTCLNCKERFEELKMQDKLVEKALQIGMIIPPRSSAYELIKNNENSRRFFNMNKKYRRWGAVAASLVICGGLLFTDPVRAMADDILKMFRLQEITSISISQSDINELDRLFRDGNGSKDIKNIGKVEVSSEEKEVSIENPKSADEIKRALGIDKIIKAPQNFEYKYARKSPKVDITMKLDVDKTNDFLTALGEKTNLPKELDQKPFIIHVSDAVSYSISNKNNNEKYIHISQMTAPVVEIPKDIDEREVIKTLFSMNFLPQNLKEQFMDIDNLTSTIPIPYNPETQNKEEISINGEKAIIVEDKNGKYLNICFKEGETIYSVYTNYSKEEVVPLIEEMK